MQDLIACLYPHADKLNYARNAVVREENSSRHIKALKKLPELLGRRSRESTAPLGQQRGPNSSLALRERTPADVQPRTESRPWVRPWNRKQLRHRPAGAEG